MESWGNIGNDSFAKIWVARSQEEAPARLDVSLASKNDPIGNGSQAKTSEPAPGDESTGSEAFWVFNKPSWRPLLNVSMTSFKNRTSYFVSYFVDQREDWRPWMCNTWRTQVPTWHSNIMYQTHPHTFWSKTADTNNLNRYVVCSGQADMSSINTLEKPKRQIKLYVSQCKPYRNNPLEFRS